MRIALCLLCLALHQLPFLHLSKWYLLWLRMGSPSRRSAVWPYFTGMLVWTKRGYSRYSDTIDPRSRTASSNLRIRGRMLPKSGMLTRVTRQGGPANCGMPCRSGLRRDEPAVRGLRIIGLEKSMQEVNLVYFLLAVQSSDLVCFGVFQWMTRTLDRSSSGSTLQESDQPSPSTNRSTSSTLFTPPSCPTSSPDTPYLMMKPLSIEKRRRVALNDVQ